MTPRPKHRRARGSGSVYQQGRVWWISYKAPDGRRVAESTDCRRKGDAEARLLQRTGAMAHNLPIVRHAERLTFNDAAQALIDDYATNHKVSHVLVKRRITKHLMPVFGGRRLVGIKTADVAAYITHRQLQGIVARNGPRKGERVADVSNAEINRELQTLKRIFNLAIEQDLIATKPKIKLLQEAPARSGFFEPEQVASVLAHLPAEIRPVIEFAYVTGWRIASEVLPLEWRQVDFDASEVRLDAGTTKNGEGRVFPLTVELRRVLTAQHAEHLRLKKAGHIVPQVFFREVAEGRGGVKKPQPIVSFGKAWKAACRAAGCPGKIPHDLRRTAVRNFVRNGIPERVAMQLTGHKTASVFQRYNIVSNGDLREAARKLDIATVPAASAALRK